MLRFMCKSKVHRVRVTQAELYYEGSLTLDKHLMDAAGMIAYEKVQIVNVNNGQRFETYLIEGEPHSGVVCLNGPAARLGAAGDEIIIISYGMFDEKEIADFKPKKIFVDKFNRIVEEKKAEIFEV
jgi:aspartate 1-decarboxylase